LLEDWKQALDQNKYIAAVLMDLSNAFDCLPHKLLLLKLEAYGMSKSALQLIENYLTNRKQCVKAGTIWLHENHSINAKLSFSKCSTTLSILSSACARVLSSMFYRIIVVSSK
jgi:hypothetical protein